MSRRTKRPHSKNFQITQSCQNDPSIGSCHCHFWTNPEYEVSEYATGNKRWRHSPAQHPVPIQDLLLFDIQTKHEQNKILGDKVAKVVRQNLHLAQQASRAYETPSPRSSGRIPSWVWSPGPCPPTCSSNTTMSRS
jgi:hypothetical protein